MRFELSHDGQDLLNFNPGEIRTLETSPPTRDSLAATGKIGLELGQKYPDTDMNEIVKALSSLSVPNPAFITFMKSAGNGIEAHINELHAVHEEFRETCESDCVLAGIARIRLFETMNRDELSRELDHRVKANEDAFHALANSLD